MDPVRQDIRIEERRPTPLTPLTALGGIAGADSPRSRQAGSLIEAMLKGADRTVADQEALAVEFQRCRERKAALAELAERAAVFQEAEGSANDHAALGAAGEEDLVRNPGSTGFSQYEVFGKTTILQAACLQTWCSGCVQPGNSLL